MEEEEEGRAEDNYGNELLCTLKNNLYYLKKNSFFKKRCNFFVQRFFAAVHIQAYVYSVYCLAFIYSNIEY